MRIDFKLKKENQPRKIGISPFDSRSLFTFKSAFVAPDTISLGKGKE